MARIYHYATQTISIENGRGLWATNQTLTHDDEFKEDEDDLKLCAATTVHSQYAIPFNDDPR